MARIMVITLLSHLDKPALASLIYSENEDYRYSDYGRDNGFHGYKLVS